MKNIPVHPAAAVFPMLPDDELQELAADIKENGLRESLKVSNGMLIDGRNRWQACRIAGVEPKIEELNGIDPVAYILSENVHRRHLSKGQRAMATAMIQPDRQQGKKTSLKNNEVNPSYVRMARTVLSVLPELAKQVLSGALALHEAYEQAQFQRKASESAETSLTCLRKNAADLAELVDEERMKLPEALAAWEQRKAEQRNQREATYGLLQKQQALIETMDGPILENMIATVRNYPQECPLTKSEIRKLAARFVASWRQVEEAMK